MPETSQKIKEEMISKVGLIEEYTHKIIEWAKVFIPQLIFAIIVLIVGLWLIKKVSQIANKGMERRNIDISLRTFLKSLIGIGLKIILYILVAGMIGVQTTSFVAILGAAGLAIGLALQGSLSNFAGGVLILVFKPYKVGDTIEAMNQKGEVKEIQIFNTILLTGDHRTIILPNGAVSNGFIVNHTKFGSLRADIEVNVASHHSIEEVKTILEEVIKNEPRVLELPAPSVTFLSYVDGGYVLSVKAFAVPKEAGPMKNELLAKIKVAFDAHGIERPVQARLIRKV